MIPHISTLIYYITNTSVDRYIEDAAGSFDWPSSDQPYGLFTDLLRPMGDPPPFL